MRWGGELALIGRAATSWGIASHHDSRRGVCPIVFKIFLMWIIFKVFIEFVTRLLLFYVLVFWS